MPVALSRFIGKHMADDLLESLRKHPRQALPFQFVLQPRIEGIDIGGKSALAPEVIQSVLISRKHILRVEAEPFGNAAEKVAGCIRPSHCRAETSSAIRDSILPDGLPVLAPEAVKRPARQLLARIPLTLAKMHRPRAP